MPVYRFRCTSCGYEYDDIAPMDSVAPACSNTVFRPTDVEGEYEQVPCGKPTMRVPQPISVSVQRGTPKFYPNRGPR